MGGLGVVEQGPGVGGEVGRVVEVDAMNGDEMDMVRSTLVEWRETSHKTFEEVTARLPKTRAREEPGPGMMAAMTFFDPLAGKSVASVKDITKAAEVWDAYDARLDGPAPMPFFYPSVRYENWWGSGVHMQELHALAQNHGIPVAWTPPADVLQDLVRADAEHGAKLMVLEVAEDEIRSLCHAMLRECTSSWLKVDTEAATHVLAAWDDGHLQAGACLALAAAEDVMFSVARVERKKKYPGLTRAASRPVRGNSWLVDEQIVLTPIEPLFTSYFPERNDPIPENLSRHAVLHRLPLEHLNKGHSIIAIMLLISLLRQAEEDARHAEADAHEYEYD
ncbi:hypothetical protein ACFOZ0_11915 [Streptomyces yaanensis]|uniref:Uncharacterized protein n=1 Tax=Streptomyces yaanensis TaxID=1142239 RepID=A0ABV7SBL7_9ACTN|nr:hypothetical protein [Streptomyces sp. CGMCC 4.7035]WNB99165.1 hypothetical protein Q2K21_14380 [Streptomyces sp. CGMCC 4.7035]